MDHISTLDVLSWARRRDGMNGDERGLTMERRCIACGGRGLAEHVDRTLPPPPCRLCRPEEAALHMALAREMRTVAAARRRDAYQMLRAAVVLGDILPPAAALSVLTDASSHRLPHSGAWQNHFFATYAALI